MTVSVIPLLVAILSAAAACHMLTWAGRIAGGRGTSIWESAKPEFGFGLAFIAGALVLAFLARVAP